MAYLTQYSSSVPIIKFKIEQSLMTIGQHIDRDICVPEDGVADNHAAVEVINQADQYRYMIKSREDEPLIELNGQAISHAELKDGDWLSIGGVEFQFTDDGVNDIVVSTDAIQMNILTKESKPQQVSKENKKPESEALTLLQELKEEVKSMTTQEFIEDSRFSRRLRSF